MNFGRGVSSLACALLLLACSGERATFSRGAPSAEPALDAGVYDPLATASIAPSLGAPAASQPAGSPGATSGLGAPVGAPPVVMSSTPTASVTSLPPGRGGPAPAPTTGATDGTATMMVDGVAQSSDCSSAECCTANDCAPGALCIDLQCACPPDKKDCDGTCIAPTACCSAADCPTGASCDAGVCNCPLGTHVCAEACVSNAAPESCGDACEPCAVPSGGTATCDGTQCGGACPTGMTLCAGQCIAEGAPCSGTCPAETRNCSNLCTPLQSVTACGDACRACAAPSNGNATCDGNECGIECDDGYKVCEEDCIEEDGCCEDADCDNGKECSQNACACPTGQRSCDDQCIDEDACCEDNECPGDTACLDNACDCEPGSKRCEDECVDPDACCDDSECDFGLGCVDFECVDTLAPKVSSISPSANATGITYDAQVRITFSEPMDEDSVIAALKVGSYLSGELFTTWNGDSTVLTLSPNGGWQYATGTSRAGTTARSYQIQLSKSARDAEGNALESDFSSSFKTLRRISETITATAYGWSTYSIAGGETIKACTGTYRVGRWTSPGNSGTYYVYQHFDFSSLGTIDTIKDLEEAKFAATQSAPTGAFYSSASVLVERATYGTIDNNILQLPVTTVGTLCQTAATSPSLSVINQFKSEWSAGNLKQLYRVAATANSELGTYAIFSCTAFGMKLTYTMP